MEIKVFENGEFGQVRTITEDGTILFCASDVAKALGYAEPEKAVRTHCKGVSVLDTPTNGGIQPIRYIPEGDVYRLILRSKLPSAERFEHWVMDEVLPSIRKHGMYAEDELLQNPDLLLKVVTQLKQEHDERLAAEKRAIALQEENQVMLPKAEYFDDLVERSLYTTFRDTAKELNVPERWFGNWLIEHGFLFEKVGKDGKKKKRPYKRWVDEGYFVLKDFKAQRNQQYAGNWWLFAVKGKNAIRLLLEKEGVLK